MDEGDGVGPVPAADVGAVLACEALDRSPARRPVLCAMIRLQLLTGMRPGEVCALTGADVDRARTPWRYAVAAFNKMLHKDARRVVFFGPKARAIIEPLPTG